MQKKLNTARAIEEGLRRRTRSTLFRTERDFDDMSGSTLNENVRNVAVQLAALQSMCPTGAKVGLCARNSVEWILLDLACVISGVTTVAFHHQYAEAHFNEIGVGHERVDILFVDDEDLGFVVNHCKTTVILPRSKIRGWLKNRSVPRPQSEEVRMGDEVLTYYFSSGSTGVPKKLAFKDSGVIAFAGFVTHSFPLNNTDVFMSLLPLSILSERLYLYTCIMLDVRIVFTSILMVTRTAKTEKPTIIAGVPGVYDVFYNLYARRVMERWVLSNKISAAEWTQTALVPLWRRCLLAPALYRLRRALGGRVKFAFTGSAPLKQEVRLALKLAKIPMFEGYGLSELGLISVNTPAQSRYGSVGRALPDKKVWIDDDGEVCVRLLVEYGAGTRLSDLQKNEARFKTGDMGRLDADGYLYISGRVDELLILQNGKKIAPSIYECKVKEVTNCDLCVIITVGSTPLVVVFAPASGSCAENVLDALRDLDAGDIGPWNVRRILFCAQRCTRENGLLKESLKIDRAAIAERAGRTIAAGCLVVDALHN